MRSTGLILAPILLCVALLGCADDGDKRPAPGTQQEAAAVDSTLATTVTAPPVAMTQFVLDPQSGKIFELNLTDNSIADQFPAQDDLVAIAFDYMGRKLYKGFAGPQPGLEVFDTETYETIKRGDFAKPISAMLFHPIKRHLFIVSEDSTNLIVFNCDSLGIEQDFPLHVTDKGFIGPTTLEPGPQGKIITANGARASVTQIFTDNSYMYQTVTNLATDYVDCAVFSRDGVSSYSCDTKRGSIYKIQFGSGEPQGQKDNLDRPRLVQIEVSSNTIVVVVGENEVLMLHADTFVEIGRVSLEDYGDEILSLQIPPKANFAELLMDYKGVTRWLRFDIRTWENTRLIELI